MAPSKLRSNRLSGNVENLAAAVATRRRQPRIIFRKRQIHNRIIVNRDVYVNFGVLGDIVQGGVEEANISLLVANGGNRSFMAAGQTEWNRIAASARGNAVVKVIASAIKRTCLDPGVTRWRTEILATVVRREAMLPVDEVRFKTKMPELADRLGLVSFKLL